jgi:hypothetical protein
MPSLNFIFRDLDMAAVHLSAIVGTLTGSGLHVKQYTILIVIKLI